ncbi:MAG: peptide chain release factor N(5)-glutamine methyltransferase [Lachnospiraceae bacterium]
MTYQEALKAGENCLTKAGVDSPRVDAWTLLEHVCHVDRTYYLTHFKEELSSDEEKKYHDFLTQRANHVPLQYITGYQCFMGYDFKVNSSVLIPRQDTEVLVEEVSTLLHEGDRVLDLCTGSGCIITSLKCMNPSIQAVGSDISKDALLLAKENAKNNRAEVEFVYSDLFEKIEGTFHVIVSNPPYIKSAVIEGLDSEVKDYEPYEALDGKEDGLYFYRLIIEQSKEFLVPGGHLCFEIGYDQGAEVSELLKEQGYQDIQVKKDLAGLDRVITARKG